MKIDVVYEKADILKLVVDDLRRKGIRVKVGHSPTIKSPLEVKLAVETEDEAGQEAPSTAPAPQVAVQPQPKNGGSEHEEPPADEEGGADMTDVLRQSNSLVMTSPGKFEPRPSRPLGRNESYDFPKEE